MHNHVKVNLPYHTGARHRQAMRTTSNNPNNPNQSICSLSVAKHFGVQDEVRYLQTIHDVVRAVRTRYSVRSVRSYVKGRSVGSVRKQLAGITDAKGFIVMVEGHVIALGTDGQTIIDTDSRKRDNRPIWKIYGVYAKTT